MPTATFDLPAMYADHHVALVRQMVLALPGVTAVTASAARHQLEVTFDPAQLTEAALTSALTQNGYPPGSAPSEHLSYTGELQQHSVALEHRETASKTNYAAPALGACPGLEPRIVAGEHPADRQN